MVISDVAQEVEIIGWLETEHGDKIPLEGFCSIGREMSNNIVLNTSAVSRHHGLIHKRENEFWMVDLGGINGILINGNRVIHPVRLQVEDRIQMPSALFIFRQAFFPLSALPDEKEKPPFLPASKPGYVSAQEEEQKELALAIDTQPLPPQPKKKKVPPQPPAIMPAPISVLPDEKEVSPQIPAIELPAVSVQSEEKNDLPQLPSIEPEPVSVLSEEEKEPPQTSATKPRGKTSNDRRKRRSAPATSAPASSTSDPQNVCLTAKRSMYLGFASIFLPFIGLIPAVVAIVLGHRALRTIHQSNGALLGRDKAITGLYFGYITLPIILVYSTFFYVLNFSSPSSPAVIANISSIPTFAPVMEIPKSPNPPSAPPAAIVENSQNASGPAPSPIITSTESTPSSLPPAAVPKSEDTQSPTPTEKIPSVHNTASDEYVARAPVSLRSDPSLTETSDKNGLTTVSSSLETPKPVATENSPPVFSYEVQTKLKDGMLEQPMPLDSSDRSYSDAEAFNNSARILARQPEAKYAESVRDFLDDVKHRNPDPVRLQILSAMYANYMAALKQPETSGN